MVASSTMDHLRSSKKHFLQTIWSVTLRSLKACCDKNAVVIFDRYSSWNGVYPVPSKSGNDAFTALQHFVGARTQGPEHRHGQLPATCRCYQAPRLVSHNKHPWHLSDKFHNRAAGTRYSPWFTNFARPRRVTCMLLELLCTTLLLWNQHHSSWRSQICV